MFENKESGLKSESQIGFKGMSKGCESVNQLRTVVLKV